MLLTPFALITPLTSLTLSAQLGVQESGPGPQDHRADPQGSQDRGAGGAAESAPAAPRQGQQEAARSGPPHKSSLELSAAPTQEVLHAHFLSLVAVQSRYCAQQQTGSPPLPLPSVS